MTNRRDWYGLVLSVVVAMSVVPGLAAQNQGLVNRALAAREDLEGLLAAARQGTGPKLTARERQVVEHRLQEGDFLVGDRLVVRVEGEKALNDTFTVRAGQSLALPDMAPLPLHGVLRSELQTKLQAHVAQYIREPAVYAEALIRIGILGSVARPGYYNVRADQPLGDMLSVAGGLSGDADLGKARVLRDGNEFWPREEVRRAMASGKSLDVLGLQGGDEIQVGRRGAGFGTTLTVITGVVTLAATIILLTRNN
jgi:protein involved in polysaccharide export with SLBB domain